MVDVEDDSLQADSQPKLVGLAATLNLHSHGPGELWHN